MACSVDCDITIVSQNDIVTFSGSDVVTGSTTENNIVTSTGSDRVIAMIFNDRGVTGYVY